MLRPTYPTGISPIGISTIPTQPSDRPLHRLNPFSNGYNTSKISDRAPMKYNPQKHHRRSIRLKGHNYTIGAYFVTICTSQRACLFGEVIAGKMFLNSMGKEIETCWKNLPNYFQLLRLDQFIIMPNHLHGILWLDTQINPSNLSTEPITVQLYSQDLISTFPPKGTTSGSLGAIIQNFKSTSTRRVNRIDKAKGRIVWQRNYYERIIRDEYALKNIQNYIHNNPQAWMFK
jgi:putative transposase